MMSICARQSRAISMVLASLAVSGAARASIIAEWDFNSSTPDGNPATGTMLSTNGLGVASIIGTATSSFVSGVGSADPAQPGDNSALRLSNFLGNNSQGLQFAVNTAGYSNVGIAYSIYKSGLSPGGEDFRATSQGVILPIWLQLPLATDHDDWVWRAGLTTSLKGASNAVYRIYADAASQPSYPGTGIIGTANGSSTVDPNSYWLIDNVIIFSGTIPEPTGLPVFAVPAAAVCLRRPRRDASRP